MRYFVCLTSDIIIVAVAIIVAIIITIISDVLSCPILRRGDGWGDVLFWDRPNVTKQYFFILSGPISAQNTVGPKDASVPRCQLWKRGASESGL